MHGVHRCRGCGARSAPCNKGAREPKSGTTPSTVHILCDVSQAASDKGLPMQFD